MLSKKQKRSLKEKGRIAFEEATHNLAEPIEVTLISYQTKELTFLLSFTTN